MVDFDIPHPTSGVKDVNYIGTGLIVDADQGLVLVDRDTVPVSLGDLILTFGGTVRVPARLRYLHPVHNFAVLQYDPAAIGVTEVQAAVLLADADVEVGDKVWQVGLNGRFQTVDLKTEIEQYDTVPFHPSTTPRFRDVNMQAMGLTKADPSLGGAISDKKGRVLALWASFIDQREGDRSFWGLPIDLAIPAIEAIKRGEEPTWYWIGAEMLPTTLADARDRGLSEERAQELFELDPKRRQVLTVVRMGGGTDAASKLREGDLVVAVNGEPVTQVGEVEKLLDPWNASGGTLTIVRDRAEQDVTIEGQALQGQGVTRMATWAGLVVHEPHREVAEQRAVDAKGLYIAWLWYGTPAARYGLRPTRRIVEIDNKPVADLDEFLAAVEGLEHRQSVRLKVISLNGRESVHTLKLDLMYWPTLLFERKDGVWVREER